MLKVEFDCELKLAGTLFDTAVTITASGDVDKDYHISDVSIDSIWDAEACKDIKAKELSVSEMGSLLEKVKKQLVNQAKGNENHVLNINSYID